MNRIAIAIFFLFATLGNATAASSFAGEFLSLGAGARALALGSAYVAVTDDPTAVYWNPAGLTRLSRKQLHLTHAERFAGMVNHDFAAIARPGKHLHGVGLALLRVGVNDIHFTELADPGRPLSQTNRPYIASTETSADYAFYLSLAHRLRTSLSLGASVKVIYRQVASLNAYGLGLDLGLTYELRPGLSLAANIRDITSTPIIWNTDADDRINPSILLGATYQVTVAGGRATVALASRAGGGTDVDSGMPVHTGIEYNYRSIALRGGLEGDRQSLGLGLQPHQRITLDFAYLQHDQLESTYQFSANLSF